MSDDDTMWQQPPEPIESRPNGTSVVSLRLPTPLFHDLLRAARSEGLSVSAYVRRLIEAEPRQSTIQEHVMTSNISSPHIKITLS
ncbi:MAG TPA: hypothetical protein VJO13_09055 [Ktedonobacterales bacterium]|nr:hypothetical protein [Ktedonobacterales bacterium]